MVGIIFLLIVMAVGLYFLGNFLDEKYDKGSNYNTGVLYAVVMSFFIFFIIGIFTLIGISCVKIKLSPKEFKEFEMEKVKLEWKISHLPEEISRETYMDLLEEVTSFNSSLNFKKEIKEKRLFTHQFYSKEYLLMSPIDMSPLDSLREDVDYDKKYNLDVN